MATRNLAANELRIKARLETAVEQYTRREVAAAYQQAFDDSAAVLSRLLDVDPSELNRAQRTQLLRRSQLVDAIMRTMGPYLTGTRELTSRLAQASFDGGFFHSAWAVNQAAGVDLAWGMFDPAAVQAAVGLGGDVEALRGLMSEGEIRRHRRVLDKAFRNYDADTRRWISREITQGVLQGESVPRVRKRLQGALMHSRNSAELIARTESLRALGVGSRIAYEDAADKGVNIRQIWDATLDDRTRPDHAQMDGVAKDGETGMFVTPWGPTPGPRESGKASEDINCRCVIRPEIEGYSPEVRRIQNQGVQPYQTFSEWARAQGTVRNRYGQKYDFLIPIEL